MGVMFRASFFFVLMSCQLAAQSTEEQEAEFRKAEAVTRFKKAIDERDSTRIRGEWLIVCHLDKDDLIKLVDLCDNYSKPSELAWITSAIDRVAARSPQAVGIVELERILKDKNRAGQSRRIALSLLEQANPGYRSHFLATADHDPEFLRDHVAEQIEAATQLQRDGDSVEATRRFLTLYSIATDPEQIIAISEQLRDKTAVGPLHERLGVVSRWHVIGPFPSEKRLGPQQTFPVETKYLQNELRFDEAIEYEGKSFEWKGFEITPEATSLKFAQVLPGRNDSVYFAATTLESSSNRSVEVLASGHETLQLWLNGEMIIDAPFYDQRPRLDRYRSRVELKEGPNVLFAKVCMGEGAGGGGGRGGSPAGELILRIVDDNGTGIKLQP